MLTINRSTITDGGMALLNSGDPVNITSIKTGSGTYTSSEDIVSRTTLKSQMYSYAPNSVYVSSSNRTVSGLLANYDPDTETAIVTADYTLTEVGLFATVNGSDVLFAIGISYDGTTVPAFTGQNKSEIVVNWEMGLSGTDNITVDSTGAYALATDLNDHIGDEVYSNDGVHGLRAVNNNGRIVIQLNNSGAWVDVDSGHIVMDENGNTFPHRTYMQFINSTITDNEDDDITEVYVEGIGTTVVQIPSVVVGTYTYDGTAQGPTITWAAGMSQHCIVTGATATNAGTYTLTIALRNTAKMVWADMTTADKTWSYTINPKTVSIPTVSGSYTYNGSEKSAVISVFDPTEITQGGTSSATNAGTYTVTFDLKNGNYVWSDTTTSQKTGTWTIAKANQTITLSAYSVTLNNSNTSATVTVSGNQGSISASSNNTSKATTSVSGTTVTITRQGSVVGSSTTVTVTITAAATTNYNSISATVSVTVIYVTIVSWANGTSTEIADMVAAAADGYIDIEDYWNVGDERTVTLASPVSETVKFVIEDLNGQTSGGTSYVAAVGQKNGLTTEMLGPTTGYNLSTIKTYLEGNYQTALQNATTGNFWNCVKSATHKSQNPSGGLQTTTTKIIIHSIFEYIGTYNYATDETISNGFHLFKYYETSANRIKKKGENGSSGWLNTRSSSSSYADRFCGIQPNGEPFGGGNGNGIIAPFCII